MTNHAIPTFIRCPCCGCTAFAVVCMHCGFIIYENPVTMDLYHNINPCKHQHNHRVLAKLSPEAVRKIIEEYKQGKPIREIMEKYGILSCKTLYNILRDNGVRPRKNKSPHRKVDEQMIVKMYLNGKSIYAIAKELGLSTSRVYYVLKKHGLK